MPRLRDAEQALSLAANFSRQPYICRSCRARAIRHFHSSPSSPAAPFLQRVRESLFGTAESQEVKKKREEQVQRSVEEQAKRDAVKTSLETKTDSKGREYEVAAIYDPSINPEYVMSTNWDGLRRIGSGKWIKERADPGEKYVGFMPGKRSSLSDKQWQQLLHHVAVEALALEAARRDLNDISLPRSGEFEAWRQTRTTSIKLDEETGAASLQFASAESHEGLLSYIPQAEPEVSVSENDGAETTEQLQEPVDQQEGGGESTLSLLISKLPRAKLRQYEADLRWMNMRLNNPLVKLAIVKRIMQLTGHRIADPAISNANTLRDLYETLKTKEPPKKLADTPELQRLNRKAPNVAVYDRRRTMIDKEKEVGRWKIIEDELIARDLPVTGRRWPMAKPRTGVKMHKSA